MKVYGEITVSVEHEENGPVCIEVFSDDWMLGVWRAGYPDVWAFALEDKNIVRSAVRAELERLGQSP